MLKIVNHLIFKTIFFGKIPIIFKKNFFVFFFNKKVSDFLTLETFVCYFIKKNLVCPLSKN